MPQNPGPDVGVAGIAQDAVGQDDSHPAAWLEPLHAALDEQNLGRDTALLAPGVTERTASGGLPDAG